MICRFRDEVMIKPAKTKKEKSCGGTVQLFFLSSMVSQKPFDESGW
jgi:hypothetical protein